MSRSMFRGLLMLNGLLIIALVIVSFSPPAAGQRVNRPRGEYTMVAARAQGITEAAIYIVDASNQEMLVVRYDRSTKSLKFIGFRDLAADAQAAMGRGR
jgi:hypothetical protein